MDLRPRDAGRAGWLGAAPAVGEDRGLVAVRELADALRAEGVLAVAGPALARARPAGIDLLGVLGVLAGELAGEWRAAAASLPVLHPDRLQLNSAAALLSQAITDPAAPSTVDPLAVGRAAALHDAVQAPDDGRTLDEGNLLLDRTWSVLNDLRDVATASPRDDELARASALVPSVTEVEGNDGTRLAPTLAAAAATGALVGMLAPWLPPPRHDPASRVHALMQAVSELARRHQDDQWWVTMTTIGRTAASLSIAASFAVAAHPGPADRAAAHALTEPALVTTIEAALAAALSVTVGPEAATTTTLSPAPLPPAQPSASQQARAAAERAAAERAATQQAFVERATAHRAAVRASLSNPQSGEPTETMPKTTESVPRTIESVPRTRPSGIPSLADIQAELGEAEEPVPLGIWDTLMGPR